MTKFALIDHDNDYFRMIHSSWGERLRQVFAEIPDPQWAPVSALPEGKSPLRSEPPLATGLGLHKPVNEPALAQTLAQAQDGQAEPD